MATDLASPVGLGHPDEEEYIDYSDDEPETSPIKPNADSTSYFESARPNDLLPESMQGVSAGAADSTTLDLDGASEVANAGSKSLLQSDAVLADGIQHDDPFSMAQAVQPGEGQLAENEITWDEDEGKDEQYDEEESMQHELTGNAVEYHEHQMPSNVASAVPGPESDAKYHSAADNQPETSAQEAKSDAAQGPSAEVIDTVDDIASAPDLSVQEHDDLNEIDYEDDEAIAADLQGGGLEAQRTGDDGVENPDPSERQSADGSSKHLVQVDGESSQEALEPSFVEEEASHAASVVGEEESHGIESAADPNADAEVMIADSSAASLDTPEEEDAEMPVVTVLWHGVEYPLFYNSAGSEGRDCFFHDLSVLHCKMEELLASLRRVLADDVADSDELVLQVEELGLEFAESSHPDHFSEITFGSILQVFDHLVKNKDPEAKRPMYALLITRPSCSKRWSSLIEDAWNGKNIEEISYSFHSREQDAIEEAEVEAEDAEMFLNQEDLDDEMGGDFGDLIEQENQADHEPHDPFDEGGRGPELPDDAEQKADDLSVDGLGLAANLPKDSILPDEPGLGESFETEAPKAAPTADGSDIVASIADAALLDDLAGLGELDAADPVTAALSTLDEPTATVAALEQNAVTEMAADVDGESQSTLDLNGISTAFPSHPCSFPDFCLCPNCLLRADEEQQREEDSFRLECLARSILARDTRQTEVEISVPRSNLYLARATHFRHLHTLSDTSTSYSVTSRTDNVLEAALHGDAFNPLLTAEASNDISNEQQQVVVDIDTDALLNPESGTAGVDESLVNQETPVTSATATLDGDEVGDLGAEIDLTADIPQGGEMTNENSEHGPNDLEEIDWRDFPGDGDDEFSHESTSVSGKRPRADEDDLQGAEDEQDAKRLRS
ncbi:hypothetical protein ACHAQH_001505 [Verticillium albo-atrum]